MMLVEDCEGMNVSANPILNQDLSTVFLTTAAAAAATATLDDVAIFRRFEHRCLCLCQYQRGICRRHCGRRHCL